MMNLKLNLSRRRALLLAAATSVAAWSIAPAIAAEEYPNRPVTFIAAFPAGSSADVLVRYFAQKVSEVAGQPIIVENKPGAAGNIAAEYSARAEPNGYTVYVHSGSGTAGNYHLWHEPVIDPREDLRGVAFINQQAFNIVVGADSPFQTIEELNAFLQESGEDATYSVVGTSGRVLGAAYVRALDVNPVEVIYSTAPEALPDIVGLVVDFATADPVFAMVNERDGRTRMLATAAGNRLGTAPDVPTLKEAGLDVEQVSWWGAWVPSGTADNIVYELNDLFRQVLETEETREFVASMGGDVWIGSPEEVDEMMVRTVDEWERLVELAAIPKN